MNTEIKLQQTENNFEIIGKLMDITYISPNDSGEIRVTKAGNRYVSGNFIIDTNWKAGAEEDPNHTSNEVRISFFYQEKKKDGTPNPMFNEGLNYKEKFKTVLASADNPAEASVIRVSGNSTRIAENVWFTPDGEQVNNYQMSAMFFSEVRDRQNKNTFTVEGDVLQVINKDIGDDEASKEIAEVTLATIGYNGSVEALTFVVEDEAAVDYISENFEQGNRVKLEGEIVNAVLRKIVEEEVAFGPPIQKVETKFENKLLVKSSTIPVDSPVDPEVMKVKLEERAGRIENLKEQNRQRNQAPTAAKSTASATESVWNIY